MSFLSVIVLSYNQENLVFKCLDSLLDSNVKDVQLIIADDASSDLTQQRIDMWLGKHAQCFESTCFIKNKSNLGTVKNLINAVQEATSVIIKNIAADDWFLPNAINIIRDFVVEHKNTDFDVVFTPLEANIFDKEGGCVSKDILPASKVPWFFDEAVEQQFSYLILDNVLRSPGAFYTKVFWEKIELRKIPVVLVEDWAMWMCGASKSQRFILLNHVIVAYRQTLESVSKNMYSPNYRIYLSDCQKTMSVMFFRKILHLSFTLKIKFIFKFLGLSVLLIFPLSLLRLIKKYL